MILLKNNTTSFLVVSRYKDIGIDEFMILFDEDINTMLCNKIKFLLVDIYIMLDLCIIDRSTSWISFYILQSALYNGKIPVFFVASGQLHDIMHVMYIIPYHFMFRKYYYILRTKPKNLSNILSNKLKFSHWL